MDVLKMPYHDQVDYWLGEICLAIGRGDIKRTLSLMLMTHISDAYERGILDERARVKKLNKN